MPTDIIKIILSLSCSDTVRVTRYHFVAAALFKVLDDKDFVAQSADSMPSSISEESIASLMHTHGAAFQKNLSRHFYDYILKQCTEYKEKRAALPDTKESTAL